MEQENFGMELHLYERYQPDGTDGKVELIFIPEGEVQVTTGQDVFTLVKDDVMVVNPGQNCRLEESANTLLCVIRISSELIHREMSGRDVYFWCNSAADDGREYNVLRNIIGQLLAEYSNEMNRLNLKKRALFCQLLDQLLNHFVLEQNDYMEAEVQDKTFAQVVRYMEEHYREHISLAAAAQIACMNESSFSRYFKKKSGVNFVSYLNAFRLRMALEDLLHTGKSILEIALDHGFTNSSMFSKSFKKAYGLSPAEYRKVRKPNYSPADVLPEKQPDAVYRERLAYLVRKNSNHEEAGIAQYRVIAEADAARPYENGWNRCINSGSAANLLQARMQEVLCKVKKELGITYIRISNIFSWDMRIRKDRRSRKFNFDMVDNVLDFLINNGMRPVLDFAQKPDRVFFNNTNVVSLEREDSFFRTLDECVWMVEEFIMHVVQKYGSGEVENWFFDLGINPMTKIDEKYFEMFDAVGGIIKSYVPAARVGGGCIPAEHVNKETMTEWIQEHRQPDFLSVAIFPYHALSDTPTGQETISLKHSTDPHFFRSRIQKIKQILRECGAENIPVILSEWNLSYSDRSFYNDSGGKAAHMLKHMTECLEDVEMAAYLYATDLNTVNYDTDAVLFGGTGLITKDGIAKPAFYAFQFMHRLGPELVDIGDRYIITSDSAGRFSILLFHYKEYNYSYYMKSESETAPEDLPGLFTDRKPVKITVELTGIPDGRYNIKTENMGIESGSVFSVWRELNYEHSLNSETLNYLKNVSVPHIMIRKLDTDHHKLTITERMEAHDIRLILVYR